MEITNAAAAEFFEEALCSFRGQAEYDRIISRFFIVAGLKLRIDAAVGQFAPLLLRALSHLEVSPFDHPTLTISAWDSDNSGFAPLKPAWNASHYGRFGIIEQFSDARFHTAVQLNPTILSMLDRKTHRAIYWTPSAAALPYWEFGAPLRPLLHEWLLGEGKLPIHGGAVGYASGGVLLAGKGGSGKSNVALSCLRSDLLYASDDFCIVSDEPEWLVHSLYCTGKIAGSDLHRHPHLAGCVSNAQFLQREKALFFINEPFSQKIILTMPIRAILLPQLCEAEPTRIESAPAAAAQRAIAMSTIELSRWTGAATFRQVARLIRSVPAYYLRIGENFPKVPALISDLLGR